jgi:uncharacterized protein YdhG (YjbR/CyaY superfamily)
VQYKANSPGDYISQIPEERKGPMKKLRQVILENLPKGIEETMSYGMIGYVVPHTIYPEGYHCAPELPLPFMNLASQKNFIAVYSMVLYAKKYLMEWFTSEYAKQCKYKLDMGKSCIRFKRMDDIPFELIGQLTAKVSTKEWINLYEDLYKNKK